MSLIQVDPRFLDAVWPQARKFISLACETQERPDATAEQIRLQIRRGEVTLLLWVENEIVTVAFTISFIDYPNRRVAHIGALGGSGAVDEGKFESVKQWCRDHGASVIQAQCDEARARLYSRIGFKETGRIVRVELC